MAERSEAKNAKQSFAPKYLKFSFLTRSFASRFLLRFAQPLLAKFNRTTYWSFSPQGIKSTKQYLSRSEIESVPTENLTCSAFVPSIFFFR